MPENPDYVTCSECGTYVRLLPNGTLRMHKAADSGARHRNCPGAHRLPGLADAGRAVAAERKRIGRLLRAAETWDDIHAICRDLTGDTDEH